MSTQVIKNCFDSHVHWLGTGELQAWLDLSSLQDPEDLKSLKISEKYFRGDWLVGFGWDENKWNETSLPHRQILDQIFPDHPVAFSRVDGHVLWVNTEALKRAELFEKNLKDPEGGKIVKDQEGMPTGVLIDLAMKPVEGLIPKSSAQDVRRHLMSGAQLFNKVGFTHIRDLSCSPTQWEESCHLDESGLLTLAVEQFFDAEDPNNFDQALELALKARQTKTKNLKAVGLKIYYDGALGSEGAYISEPYLSGSGTGLVLLENKQLAELMKRTWEHDFDIAIHVIGDEAAHQVATVAAELWDQGHQGKIHLEHVEMLRPETIAILKKINVTCHIQPSHWLTDKKWIEEKLGDLKKYIFPWQALEKQGIDFDFGSDSPIEPPSLSLTLKALTDSAIHGVPQLKGDPLARHSHPYSAWTPNTFTEVKGGEIIRVVFRGRDLL